MEISKASSGLHRYAVLCAAATWMLIIAGALVTSNDAGLSVPDWPLSYGQVFPPMVGNVRFEHGHRMVATAVGILTIVLNVWLQRREPRSWVRRTGLLALAAVIAQGGLGGLTVLFQLPFPVSVAHACLAQLFFGLMVSLAVFTSPSWSGQEPSLSARNGDPSPSLRQVSVIAVGAIFGQLLLGAALRHKGIGITAHIVGALVVTASLGWAWAATLKHYSSERNLTRPAMAAAGILLIQLLLGIGAYVARLASIGDPQPLEPMISLTVAHVAFGALTLAATLVLALRAFRVCSPREAVIDLQPAAQRAAS